MHHKNSMRKAVLIIPSFQTKNLEAWGISVIHSKSHNSRKTELKPTQLQIPHSLFFYLWNSIIIKTFPSSLSSLLVLPHPPPHSLSNAMVSALLIIQPESESKKSEGSVWVWVQGCVLTNAHQSKLYGYYNHWCHHSASNNKDVCASSKSSGRKHLSGPGLPSPLSGVRKTD